VSWIDKGRYSTFQFPDQDPYPEDFNADDQFHVSVSVKRINVYSLLLLTVITFYCYYLQENATPFTQNVETSKLYRYHNIRAQLQRYDTDYDFVLLRDNNFDLSNLTQNINLFINRIRSKVDYRYSVHFVPIFKTLIEACSLYKQKFNREK